MVSDHKNLSSGITARLVTFKTSEGLQIEGKLLRLAPQAVTFEVCSPTPSLQLSEVLSQFRILADEDCLYSGEAVVNNLVRAGASNTCSVTLRSCLAELGLFQLNGKGSSGAFDGFVSRWQEFYRLSPEYKLAVADLQNFLFELRLWSDQMEIGLTGRADRERLQASLLEAPRAQSTLGELFNKLELVASGVPEELLPVHQVFCRGQLHPLLMCSPFMHRIYAKPLGYAGDYEMIDMIVRHQAEGESLFAKLLHLYILDQAPARSVRNRVEYFARRFIEESLRVSKLGRRASIYSLGCGPAREVQRFLSEHPLSNQVQLRLLDFNDETLDHASRSLNELKRQHDRTTQISLVKKSVHQLLKGAGQAVSPEPSYDLIYCSGLYDYLSDRVCKLLNTFLYDQLRPGGVLIVTNFDPSNPIRRIQEHVFDWFLTYRTGRQMAELIPDQATSDDCTIRAEPTGCNVFLEVRKPR